MGEMQKVIDLTIEAMIDEMVNEMIASRERMIEKYMREHRLVKADLKYCRIESNPCKPLEERIFYEPTRWGRIKRWIRIKITEPWNNLRSQWEIP